jgi:hypothetical protein
MKILIISKSEDRNIKFKLQSIVNEMKHIEKLYKFETCLC